MQDYKREINGELEKKIKSYVNEREDLLSEYATKSADGNRRKYRKREDIRARYTRDADRIIHTRAYTRYIDKTQVFFLVDNDHLTHRVLHVQLVSKIARTVGRALRLNEDLIEAIALGHDIGHIPFGHLGEDILSELCEKERIGRFLHNVQSVQFLDEIEDCNLTLQVLDGILCHNGEIHNQEIKPNRDKDWDKFGKEIDEIKKEKKDYFPMTLEGCVVRVSDVIACLGRDLQDACTVELINLDNFPLECKEKIGEQNDEIINALIIDLVENSFENDFVSFSNEISEALKKFRHFNFEDIYNDERVLAEKCKIKKMYQKLFEIFLEDLKKQNKSSKIYKDLMDLDWISEEYKQSSNPAEKTRDYIAGMTDRYFQTIFEELTVPRRVKTYGQKEDDINV